MARRLTPDARARLVGLSVPQRRLTSEAVDVAALSADCGKLALLLSDRTLVFHAPYGHHETLRVPTFGRALKYDAAHATLLVGAASPEVYRVDLCEVTPVV